MNKPEFKLVSDCALLVELGTSVDNEIPTIGVLAHGLDDLYPALHRKVADKMSG